MSADQGDSEGQFRYGIALKMGGGVERNVAERVKYSKMSADQIKSDPEGLYAFSLHTGIGVDRNLSVAAKYARMSANQGNDRGELASPQAKILMCW
jgi:TPR repeat protein